MSYLDRPKIPKKPDIIPSPQSKKPKNATLREPRENEFEVLPMQFSYTADDCSIEEIDQANLVKDIYQLQDEVIRTSNCGKSGCRDILSSLENQVSGE